MRIVVLAGGIGGARFLRGLKRAVPDADITVIGNTGDDIHLFGLKVCPDLDTVMYTLGDGINEEQGWGRADETFHLKEELAAYGVGPEWFGLGDRDFATHIVRTQMISAGFPLSAVTEALCDRWKPGVRLIPMTDDRVETHVAVEQDGERRAIHFQEYWVRLRASVPAEAIVPVGAEQSKPRPGAGGHRRGGRDPLPAVQPRRLRRHHPRRARHPGGDRRGRGAGRGPLPHRR